MTRATSSDNIVVLPIGGLVLCYSGACGHGALVHHSACSGSGIGLYPVVTHPVSNYNIDNVVSVLSCCPLLHLGRRRTHLLNPNNCND